MIEINFNDAIPASDFRELTKDPGVYAFFQDGEIVYISSSDSSIRKHVSHHVTSDASRSRLQRKVGTLTFQFERQERPTGKHQSIRNRFSDDEQIQVRAVIAEMRVWGHGATDPDFEEKRLLNEYWKKHGEMPFYNRA